MPYRMPPPWDPGYAIPQNVRDEGLERRAFVTDMAPRGTYDNPRVGTGGYAVPQYIQDEGYGQGAITSAWSKSGSTPGVRVPHWLNQRPNVQAVPAHYKRYGDRAAAYLLKRVQAVPPAHRQRQVKATLDAIDPKIFPRAMAATKATGNLHAGISHAISTTLLEQVVKTGKTGRAPGNGLMGLAGCARRGSATALGAVPTKAVTMINSGTFKSLLTSLLPAAQTGPGGITAGTCDASGKYIWDAGGFWRARMAGESCASINASIPPPTSSGPAGGVTITGPGGKIIGGTKLSPTIAPGTTKLIQVGPFTFPLVDHMNVHWRGQLPDDWRAAILAQIQRDCSPCIQSSMEPASKWAALQEFLGPLPSKINHDFFGINPGGSLNGIASAFSGSVKFNGASYVVEPTQPIVTTHRPDNGEHWGLWAYLEPVDASKPYNATSNPWNLRLQWREVHDGVWSWIWDVLSTVVDWAGDVISAIGSLTCDVLTNPVGQVGAVAAGAAAGGPGGAKAGAAGAAIGAQLCAQPPPQAVVTGGSDLLPLAIMGVGVAAALLLIPKKKKAP